MINIVNLKEFKKDIDFRAKLIGDEESEEYIEDFCQYIYDYINSEIINNLIQEKDKDHISIEFNDSMGKYIKKDCIILRGSDNQILIIIDAEPFDYGYKMTGVKYFYESLKSNHLEINYCVINKNKLLFFRNKISELKDIEKAQIVFHKIYYYTRKYMVYIGNEQHAGIKLRVNEIKSLQDIPKTFVEIFSVMNYLFSDKIEFESFLKDISISKNKNARNIILYKLYYEHLHNVGFKDEKKLSIFLDLICKVKKLSHAIKIDHIFKVYSPYHDISDYILIRIHLRIKCLITGKKNWSDNYLSFKLNFNDKFADILDKPLHILYPDFKELEGITVNDYINNKNDVHRLIELMNY